MEFKEFVTKTLNDLLGVIEDVNNDSNRKIYLSETKDNRTLEFDVAVAVENNDNSNTGAGIRVLDFVKVESGVNSEVKNSTISRIKFGVHVDINTEKEGGDGPKFA